MSIDGIKFTIIKVTPALDELNQELVKQEAQMIVLGDEHADSKQEIECHDEGEYHLRHGTSGCPRRGAG